ncbi:hypothetical protein P9314_25055 [Paenibacillus validus]|uniref:hypothetical protein n=1 Tax=Paenibacillus TaxID=44249 RepID=UPI000FDBDBDD|nr:MULTISPECIES: hypothetical protein [Paenibacillus]MED4603900.1 hypothetical protein [Paenibacillus validus]MED4608951.1 hypothetical protein [Paenibacillus validus]
MFGHANSLRSAMQPYFGKLEQRLAGPSGTVLQESRYSSMHGWAREYRGSAGVTASGWIFLQKFDMIEAI